MTTRGFGWKRDSVVPAAPHPPDRSARPKLGLAPPPLTASIRPFISDILDQGTASTCVCHAVVQAYRASLIHQDLSVIPPLASRLFLHYLARAMDNETNVDSGTYLRNAFRVLVTFGVPEEAFWPYSDSASPGAKLFQKPPLDVFEKAYDQKRDPAVWKDPAYFRIDTLGNERIADIKRAIAAGHAVVFGTLVSNAFASSNFDPSIPLPPPTNLPIDGGHAMTIGEYDGDDFGIINSWGPSFGVDGWCRFSADYLAWSESNDFWILDTAPRFSVATNP